VKLIWIKAARGAAADGEKIRRRLRPLASPSHFELLLQAAPSQPEPQRLLFVFAAAELPADASPAPRAFVFLSG